MIHTTRQIRALLDKDAKNCPHCQRTLPPYAREVEYGECDGKYGWWVRYHQRCECGLERGYSETAEPKDIPQ